MQEALCIAGIILKVRGPEDTMKTEIGREEVRPRTDPLAPPTFRGPRDEKKAAKWTRKKHPET